MKIYITRLKLDARKRLLYNGEEVQFCLKEMFVKVVYVKWRVNNGHFGLVTSKKSSTEKTFGSLLLFWSLTFGKHAKLFFDDIIFCLTSFLQK